MGSNVKTVSTARELIFNTPLYQKVFITEENECVVDDIDYYNKSFEGFNPIQMKETTYTITGAVCIYDRYPDGSKGLKGSGIRLLVLECSRYKDKLTVFFYWDDENKIIKKVGQYPSIADIHIGEIKQYSKVLVEGKLKEFTRAIGLAANGVGIGSFVYLRRIFEHLIYEAYDENKEVIDPDFKKARMEDKITMMKDYLPDFLIKNKSIYSILSLGIHELTENKCLGYFDIMRTSIELILDDKLEMQNRKLKIKTATQALSQLTKELSTKK